MKYTKRCSVLQLCFMCYKFTKGCMMLMFMKCSANVEAKHQGCYSRGDQRGVVRSAPILFVLLAPLCGGALVLLLALGLAFVLTSVEDRSDHLLTRGVVGGDVEQVVGGMGFQAAKLVD